MEEKLYKFTFKTKKERFRHDSINIELNKLKVGYISNSKIRFAVKRNKTKNDPTPFKWVVIEKEFKSNNLAKTWVRKNNDMIQKSMGLYQFDYR